jgi:hypothetical protein
MRMIWVLLVVAFVACQPTKKEEAKEEQPYVPAIDSIDVEHPSAFPFEPYQKVIAYAFNQYSTSSGKMFDMPIVQEDGSIVSTAELPGITLNQTQIDTLFSLLNAPVSGSDLRAKCYDPRHAIVFYNANDSAYAYFEVCFACSNYEFFPEAKYILNSGNLNRIKRFMKDIGLPVKDEY